MPENGEKTYGDDERPAEELVVEPEDDNPQQYVGDEADAPESEGASE